MLDSAGCSASGTATGGTGVSRVAPGSASVGDRGVDCEEGGLKPAGRRTLAESLSAGKPRARVLRRLCASTGARKGAFVTAAAAGVELREPAAKRNWGTSAIDVQSCIPIRQTSDCSDSRCLRRPSITSNVVIGTTASSATLTSHSPTLLPPALRLSLEELTSGTIAKSRSVRSSGPAESEHCAMPAKDNHELKKPKHRGSVAEFCRRLRRELPTIASYEMSNRQAWDT